MGLKYLLGSLATLFVLNTTALANQNEGMNVLSFVEGTRLIFNADKKSVSFPVKNQTNTPYMLVASVKQQKGKEFIKTEDFMVMPDMLRLPSGRKQQIRVTRIGGQFPEDRESVFYLYGLFIPGLDKDSTKDSQMNLMFALNVKMFYRPESIMDDFGIEKAVTKVSFSLDRSQKTLTVRNASPYHLTFGLLKLNNVSLKNNQQILPMVEPFSQMTYPLGKARVQATNTLTWTLIDEIGQQTKAREEKDL